MPTTPDNGSGTGAGDGGHPHLKALGREVERTGRRVGELDSLVRTLAATVARLSEHLGAEPPEPGEPGDNAGEGREGGPGVRAWLLAEDPAQTEADLTDLIVWLDRVYLAYPGVSLPSCWLWHPDVVEELWWLRRAHADAYHPKTGTALRAGDWHDRQRPNVARRVRSAVNACELSEHSPGKPQAHPAARTPLVAAAVTIAAWVAAGRPDPAPEPTPAQLDEAEQERLRDLDRTRGRR